MSVIDARRGFLLGAARFAGLAGFLILIAVFDFGFGFAFAVAAFGRVAGLGADVGLADSSGADSRAPKSAKRTNAARRATMALATF